MTVWPPFSVVALPAEMVSVLLVRRNWLFEALLAAASANGSTAEAVVSPYLEAAVAAASAAASVADCRVSCCWNQ